MFAKWSTRHFRTNKWMVSVSRQTLVTFSLVYVSCLLLHRFGSEKLLSESTLPPKLEKSLVEFILVAASIFL